MYSNVYRRLRSLWAGGAETRRYMRVLEKTQWLSPAEFEAWQLAKLQILIKYAYENVPYYQQKFRREDIHPQDIKSLGDFQSLPYLTKTEINAHRNELIATEWRNRLQPESTGGSTGQPIRFFIEDSFWWWNAALEFRSRLWYGLREGDKMAWVWGAARDMPGWKRSQRIKAAIMRQRYLNAFDLTEAKMHSFAEMLSQWQPAIIRAYPSALAHFAQYLKLHGFNNIRPKLIETTAEKLTDPQRELFQEVFRCPTAECYSARELGTIGYQCPAGKLHICETRFLEVVSNNQPAAAGQLGETVITSLTQFGMPFIRYKNEDMAIAQTQLCQCGRVLPALEEITGRTADFLVTADGQYVHGAYFPSVFRIRPEVVRFQVHQTKINQFKVYLVCNQPVTAAWQEKIRSDIRTRFGSETDIEIHIVDDIPLTPAGKHRFIVSDIKPDFVAPKNEK